MSIKVLDQATIQKIAAGEVIHRPNSIVKELVENALDSGTNYIRIEIKNGGISYIQVSDFGEGIAKSDIELAVLPHSTSKLSIFSDLNQLSTMGFRGEALASIKAVCKLTIMSRTKNEISGNKLIYEEDQLVLKEEISMNPGTTVRCENIFEHIPVRKKFLKSALSEGNKITDTVYKLAVGNPQVSIEYIKDGKRIFQTNGKDSLPTTLFHLFGPEYEKNILPIEIYEEKYKVTGYISNARYYRGNRSMQYIYVNHRYIEDQKLVALIEESYQGIIPNGRFPAFQLYLDIDSSLIDVNIHPNKEKIQFSFDYKVFEHITDKVFDLLSDKHAVPSMVTSERNKTYQKGIVNLSEYANSYNTSNASTVKPNNSTYKIAEKATPYFEKTYDKHDVEKNMMPITFDFSKTHVDTVPKNDFRESDGYFAQEKTQKKNFFEDLEPIGVVFDTYIVCQHRKPQKLVFIDQHAAHERLMYEKYCKQYRLEKVDSQLLITPMIIQLKQDDFEFFLQNKMLFEKLGYDIRIFGPQSLVINAVPMILGNPKNINIFIELLDAFRQEKNIDSDFIENKIISMSCKSAVKGGNVLSMEEIKKLIQDMGQAENPYTCPHGRPTIVEMTQYDIERIFMRNK